MTVHSITRRISIWFGVLSSLVLIALGGYLYHFLDGHYLELDVATLATKIGAARHVLSQVRSESDIAANARQFQDVVVGTDRLYFRVQSKTGKTLVASSSLPIPEDVWGEPLAPDAVPAAANTWSPGRDQQYRVISAWGHVGQQAAGQVQIFLALDVSHHFKILNRYWQALITVLGACIAAAVLLGWWVAQHELRAVKEIAATAHKISMSSLGERLQLAETPVELRQLVEAFNGMLSRLEDSFTRLSGFSTDLAHELRTPIHNLMLDSQVALDKARSADEYREVLEANVEELERLARMVGDMLFLATAEQAQAVLRKEHFDLREEVDKVGTYFEPLAEDRELRIECEGRGMVHADRRLVERMVSNLLSNAVRHGDPGSVVRISIGNSDSGVRLEVTNSGPGIPAELQARVFDRFFRVNPSRPPANPGSGLGLAIVKSIVELHGGSVTVRSNSAGPTTFTASFPA